MFDCADTARAQAYRRGGKKIVVGASASHTRASWDYVRVFNVLATFTSTKTLILWHLNDFPYYQLPEWLTKFPLLQTFEVLCRNDRCFMPRYYTPHLRVPFPNITRLYLSDVRWVLADRLMDQSTCALAHLSSLTSLRSLRTDVPSWLALSRSRSKDALSITAQLKEIIIETSNTTTTEEMRSLAWVRGLFRALRQCAAQLEQLRVEVPWEVVGAEVDAISLHKLTVFIGPEGLLDKLTINGPLTVLWITSGGMNRSITRWEKAWFKIGSAGLLRLLRVGLWDVAALDPYTVLTQLPNLEEFSFSSTAALTKHGLVRLGKALEACPLIHSVAVYSPPETMDQHSETFPSASAFSTIEVVEIASSWREKCPRLEVIRLDITEEWEYGCDWVNGRPDGWTPRYLPFQTVSQRLVNLPKGLDATYIVIPPRDDDEGFVYSSDYQYDSDRDSTSSVVKAT
ncbi:hypothetical protein V5O48_004943 [Marasmius crinis-equi]|uniref:Uncharacterized protein n=1 Tax=Marasmius crinis-equi TaxID=585013 RepID=A0ABR3FNN3_9AGAR